MSTTSVDLQALGSPQPSTADTGNGRGKLIHLQILRAIAASLVVANHTFGSLETTRVNFRDYERSGDLLGGVGVCAFFILSGLIMVRQSSDRFGAPRSPFVFLYHRILRIVPLYWIATLLWFNSLRIWHVPTVHAKAQLFRSLFFIPDTYSPMFRMNPILGQGWTLNYEMSFYLLFAIALFFPRRIGIGILLATPFFLTHFGRIHYNALAGSVWSFYT